MNRLLVGIFLLCFISESLAMNVIIKFDLKNDQITDYSIEMGSSGEMYAEFGEYNIMLLDQNKTLLKTLYFNTMVDRIYDSPKPVPITSKIGYVRFDYYSEMRYLIIRKNETLLKTVDLETYFCNKNSVCNSPTENHLTCPDDCPAYVKDGYCSQISTDGKCDPDCGNRWDKDCPIDETTNAVIVSETYNESKYKPSDENKPIDPYNTKSGCLPFLVLPFILIFSQFPYTKDKNQAHPGSTEVSQK